jgi:hypothetical protein
MKAKQIEWYGEEMLFIGKVATSDVAVIFYKHDYSNKYEIRMFGQSFGKKFDTLGEAKAYAQTQLDKFINDIAE